MQQGKAEDIHPVHAKDPTRKPHANDKMARRAGGWLLSRVLAFLTLLQLVAAHMIELRPAAKDCFYEDLHIGDQMTLTYQVGGGGHLDIDTVLTEPSGRTLFELYRKDTGSYSFTAQEDGRYTYCFSNEFSTVSDKTVSFNVHGIIYVPDEGDMQPIEREIRDLAQGLQAVKDEQEYLVVRERVHRNSEYRLANRDECLDSDDCQQLPRAQIRG